MSKKKMSIGLVGVLVLCALIFAVWQSDGTKSFLGLDNKRSSEQPKIRTDGLKRSDGRPIQ